MNKIKLIVAGGSLVFAMFATGCADNKECAQQGTSEDCQKTKQNGEQCVWHNGTQTCSLPSAHTTGVIPPNPDIDPNKKDRTTNNETAVSKNDEDNSNIKAPKADQGGLTGYCKPKLSDKNCHALIYDKNKGGAIQKSLKDEKARENACKKASGGMCKYSKAVAMKCTYNKSIVPGTNHNICKLAIRKNTRGNRACTLLTLKARDMAGAEKGPTIAACKGANNTEATGVAATPAEITAGSACEVADVDACQAAFDASAVQDEATCHKIQVSVGHIDTISAVATPVVFKHAFRPCAFEQETPEDCIPDPAYKGPADVGALGANKKPVNDTKDKCEKAGGEWVDVAGKAMQDTDGGKNS